jgi:hypothetical protein
MSESGHSVRNVGLVIATGGFIFASLFFLQLGPFAKGVSTTTVTQSTSSGTTFTSQVCPWYGFNCTVGTFSVSGTATVSVTVSASGTTSTFTSKSCGNPFGLFC